MKVVYFGTEYLNNPEVCNSDINIFLIRGLSGICILVAHI